MASEFARENTRFYVGRREINGTEEEIMHLTDYNRLWITEQTFARTDGFNEPVTANRVAAYFNNIEQNIADDLGIGKRFHYFTFRKDDQVSTLGNYEIPEQEVPEEEETPPEEEAPAE